MHPRSVGRGKLRFLAMAPLSLFVAVSISPCFAAPDTDNPEITQLLNRYLEASKTQQDSMKGVQMQVDIEAKLPKLAKQGKMLALRSISKLGSITYKALDFFGDPTVKNEVIARYLSADSQPPGIGTLAVNKDNFYLYKYKIKATLIRDGHQIKIFEITPKKNLVGLIKGDLWLDMATAMPVRESGTFVKTPSVLLKKVAFVRDYEIRDGIAFPSHIQSITEVRVFGKAELSINFSNFTRHDNADADAALPVGGN